jgi:streptogramin lyase
MISLRSFGMARGADLHKSELEKRPARCRRRGQPRVEALETRQMLTTITEFSALASGTNGSPTQLTDGLNGNIWFTEPNANDVGVFSPTTHSVSSQLPTMAANADPHGIVTTLGASPAVWFTMSADGQLGKFTTSAPSSPTIYNYSYLPPTPAYQAPAGVTTVGTDVWIAVPGVNKLEDFSQSAGGFVAYSLSPANIDVPGFASQLTAGSDGNLWFTEPGGIGIFSLASDTVIAQVSLPTSGGTQVPSAITAGSGNTIWFTESVPGTHTAAVGVISTTTHALAAEFNAPTNSSPAGITEGPDGNMWFTESGAGAIGMVNVNSLTDPTQDTLGASTAIPIGVVSHPDPQGIISGPDNSLWFADSSGAIGEVTPGTPNRFMAAAPIAATAGIGFGLTVAVGASASDLDAAFDGSVTATLFNQADVAVGTQTMTAHGGVVNFTGLTLDAAASGYSIAISSTASGAPAPITTNTFTVVPAAPTQVIVTSAPPTTINAAEPFGLTVKLEDQFGNLATNFSGAVTASLVSIPPGGSTLGGNTSVIVSPTDGNPGFATFTGLSLNNAGNYILKIAAGSGATTTAGIDVAGSVSPPPSPTIIAETAVFTQKVNPKTHKKVGKPVFAGYMITFSTAMNTSTLGNSSNYVIDTVVPVKKTKHKPATVKLTPVGFSVTSTTSNTVTLKPPATAFSTKAGQIEVNVGVESAAGAFLTATEMLTIAKGGKRITLA